MPQGSASGGRWVTSQAPRRGPQPSGSAEPRGPAGGRGVSLTPTLSAQPSPERRRLAVASRGRGCRCPRTARFCLLLPSRSGLKPYAHERFTRLAQQPARSVRSAHFGSTTEYSLHDTRCRGRVPGAATRVGSPGAGRSGPSRTRSSRVGPRRETRDTSGTARAPRGTAPRQKTEAHDMSTESRGPRGSVRVSRTRRKRSGRTWKEKRTINERKANAREGRVRVRRGARAFCPTMVVGFIFNFLAWVERVWPSGCPTIDHACSLLASSDITLLESIAETLLQFVLGGLVSLPLLACFFPREKAQGTALLIPFLGENKI